MEILRFYTQLQRHWCGCTLPAAVHLTVNRTQWNEKIDDVVAGLDGPSGLWVHGWMDGQRHVWKLVDILDILKWLHYCSLGLTLSVCFDAGILGRPTFKRFVTHFNVRWQMTHLKQGRLANVSSVCRSRSVLQLGIAPNRASTNEYDTIMIKLI